MQLVLQHSGGNRDKITETSACFPSPGHVQVLRSATGMPVVPAETWTLKKSVLKTFRLSISTILLFGSAGMTFVAVGLALYLGFSSAIENTRTLLYQRASQVIDGLLININRELDPIGHHAARLSHRVASGEVDPRDKETWHAVVGELAHAFPQIDGVAFFSLDLQGRIYSGVNDRVIERDFSMLPRATRLLELMRNRRDPLWLSPVWSPTLEKVIIPVAVPLYVSDQLIGIHTAVIALANFSDKVSQTMRGSRLTPFVIYDNNWLLAHPAVTNWSPTAAMITADMAFGSSQDAALLPELESLEGQKVAHFWEAEKARLFGEFAEGEIRVGHYDGDGNPEIFVSRTVTKYGNKEWIVGVHFDGDLEAPEIRQLRIYGFVSLGVLLLAVGAAATIGGLTSRPIRRLAAAARAVRNDNLDAVPVLMSSQIKELDDAAGSFNEMVIGLKERARIRDLFGKYIPESIATQLLSDQADLAPQTSEATVLFVDLERFTALSETLTPQQIADLLNSYFSTVVEIIESHQGVITQFQGDAILAIFNVPVADPQHAEHAVAAAQEMLAAVSRTKFAGHQLAIRVGINTGEIFAGNIGAQDRLNYTVHGDAVNTAARLEAMNKETGTRILIGGTTAARLNGVALRQIPDVTIRGKEETIAVFAVQTEDNLQLT